MLARETKTAKLHIFGVSVQRIQAFLFLFARWECVAIVLV